MKTHTDTWGHVGLEDGSPSLKMQEAEDNCLTTMLRCRHGRKESKKPVSLSGCMPSTNNVIFNPNTLQELADIFETNIDKAF